MTAEKLLALMDWVPHLGQITGLRITTQDKCNPNTCKQIVKKLVAAKKAAGAPMITKLVLHGQKIYGSLIPVLTKNEVGKNLTSLSFYNVSFTQKTKLGEALGDLFKTLTYLEELHMPLDGDFHPEVMSPLKRARSGASTLLRVLDITGGWRSRVSLGDLSKLGTCAPELEVLRVGELRRPSSRQYTDALLGMVDFDLSSLHGGSLEQVLASPMQSLPRLKEFAVGRLIGSSYGGAPKCKFVCLCVATFHFALVFWLTTFLIYA